MEIRFLQHSVKKINIEYDESANKEHLGSMTNLNYGPGFPDNTDEGNDDQYAVVFELTVYTEDRHRIEVEFHAFFQTSEPIDEDFKQSAFLSVNSPAIAFPYLRAYIGNICMLSGFEPLVLPTINFQALHNDKAN